MRSAPVRGLLHAAHAPHCSPPRTNLRAEGEHPGAGRGGRHWGKAQGGLRRGRGDNGDNGVLHGEVLSEIVLTLCLSVPHEPDEPGLAHEQFSAQTSHEQKLRSDRSFLQ